MNYIDMYIMLIYTIYKSLTVMNPEICIRWGLLTALEVARSNHASGINN